MKYMQPRPKTYTDLFVKVRAGKSVVKESLVHAVKYSREYREYWQKKEDQFRKEVDWFEKNILRSRT